MAECTNDGHQACYTEVFRKETGDKSYKKVETDVLNFVSIIPKAQCRLVMSHETRK